MIMSNEVVTFGCRLNIFESEVIKQQLDNSNSDDIAVFNSCAVTSEAERQLRQAIRKYHKNNPEKKIIVTGCAAQINPDLYQKLPEVSGVLGNNEKLYSKHYDNICTKNEDNIIVSDILQLKETANHMVTSFEGKCRAFIEIQNGCNHRCTFCIIPYGRGNNRSVPIAQIIDHCQELLNKGINEIVLTGVDITDYGANLSDRPTLGHLISSIIKYCPELTRLRLSSLDVAEIDEELLELIKYESRVLPHFHLSIQSGDNMILKRMKRRHNREQVYEFCNSVRKYRPDVAFGADIITGFPTETEEMFYNSLNLVKELQIPLLHIFPYSEREGTPAAKIPQNLQVAKHIRKERARLLIDEGKIQLQNFMKNFINQRVTAIIESNNILRTEHFLKVQLDNNLAIGSIHHIEITDFSEEYMLGRFVNV
mgnify:CR=1 FL=1